MLIECPQIMESSSFVPVKVPVDDNFNANASANLARAGFPWAIIQQSGVFFSVIRSWSNEIV